MDSCNQDSTKEECDSENQRQINGCDWTFHSGKTCQEMGFPHLCQYATTVYCR